MGRHGRRNGQRPVRSGLRDGGPAPWPGHATRDHRHHLVAGFASTVGWPLSAYLESTVGWRGACMAWAALHLVIGLPLHVLLPSAASTEPLATTSARSRHAGAKLSPKQQRRAAFLMAFVFAVTWFISTAMAAHLPALLQSAGATLAVAVGIAALVGPAQVAGRLVEFTLLKHAHPLLSAHLATLAHSLGVLCLAWVGTSATTAFAVLHGLGNGILTIAIGTLPLWNNLRIRCRHLVHGLPSGPRSPDSAGLHRRRASGGRGAHARRASRGCGSSATGNGRAWPRPRWSASCDPRRRLRSRSTALCRPKNAFAADAAHRISNARKSLTFVCVGPVNSRSPMASK